MSDICDMTFIVKRKTQEATVQNNYVKSIFRK